jgi:hypothetical protein
MPIERAGVANLDRSNQLRNIADAMRRANVPEPTINQVIE